MSKRKTTTKVRLTIALGLMYKDVQEMMVVTAAERGARDESSNILRSLLNSPRFMEKLAEKMDEVQ